MKTLKEKLGHEWLFCDGATGTFLQQKGLKGGELPELWNLTRPEDILDLYCSYLKAGCDIITCNTFGANSIKFPDQLSDIVSAAIRLGHTAKERTGRTDAFVALDIGPTGKLLEPMGDLGFEDAVKLFSETVIAGAQSGADLVMIETMSDAYEAKAAVLAAKENCSLPVFVTSVFDTNGRLLTGGTIESTVAMLEGLGVDALGVNCGTGPANMIPVVKRLAECASVPIIVNPNAGLPSVLNGKTVYNVDPLEFSEQMEQIAGMGVQLLGGCCGTTPEHIRRMIGKVRPLPFKENTRKHRCVVSSASRTVTIGDIPVIIGERINPTGKKKFKEALRNQDMDYILDEGLKQEAQGAHILDVNAGLPEIDEPAMMEAIVKELQSVTNLPLQLDTSDPAALERALRIYNGKPMINSVNGKKESIESVMPLAAKYGGVLVCLLLDENGIPETADGRFAIAERLVKEAQRYGIARENLVMDALAMTISHDTSSAKVTLETLKRVHDVLGVGTILGISNISFGLPARELVNSSFLTMALQSGLSCAIMNPGSAAMMQAYHSGVALLGMDPQCMNYIEAYKDYAPTVGSVRASAAKESSVQSKPEVQPAREASDQSPVSGPLLDSVRKGMKKAAAEAAAEGLKTRKALDLINEELIPALDLVGQGFEKGTIFLPQLLMSAEAAKAAFDVIKESLAGTPREIKGRVILATVKGDIHDIGKNIVRVMLENYGYDVLDLGKDVPPEVITETAVRENIQLVGLSALMTTTVVSMEETIKLLRKKKPDCKICVGGAVMTRQYADAIGADFYAKDAMATVRYSDSVFLPSTQHSSADSSLPSPKK